jgi:hypothetical protein
MIINIINIITYTRMSQILNTLFLKRFCLPSNTDISSFENEGINIPSCLCGNYNHAACILKGKVSKGKG